MKLLQGEFQNTEVLNDIEKCQLRVKNVSNPIAEKKSSVEIPAQMRQQETYDCLKITKKLQDPNWKVRIEGFDDLEKFSSNNSFKISMTGFQELLNALKSKLNDPNKNIIKIAVNFIGNLVDCFGKEFKIYAKSFIISIIYKFVNKIIKNK